MIVKDKLSYFQAIESYHHTHTYSVKTPPESKICMPGVQYTIVELGKFTKKRYADLKTQLEKIYCFLQNVDKPSMPYEETVAIYKVRRTHVRRIN